MPIYEYRCAKCGDFDVMQKITEKPLRKCPTCKGKVAKLLSNTAFQLKGSGWYVTDYAGKGKAATEKSESSSSETSKAPESTKSGEGEKKAGGSEKSSSPPSSSTSTA
jgi:putative FmdB family regulatory protein